jgi:diguanylate cyclase (GGDEF)-like protein
MSAALQALAFAYVWFGHFRERAVAELFLGSAATVLGVALAYSRPHLDPILTHVLANMLITGGQTLHAFAIGRFIGRPLPGAVVVAIPVAVGIAIAYFLYVQPRLDIRIAVYSLGVAAASGITAALLLGTTPRGPLRNTHWPVGALFLLQGVLAVVRTAWVLVDTPSQDLFENARLQVMWFSQAIILINLSTLGLCLMITQRPRLDLDRQVNYDLLTGALNRPGFERVSDAEWSRSTRHDIHLSLLMLDLDRFKAFNSSFGGEVGDAWLKAFSEMARGLLRREDLLCRFRDDEFVILLPQTPFEAGLQAAERIRRATEGLRVLRRGTEVGTTVSIGVAARTAARLDLKAVMAAAERALHRAKAAGRNRVEADEAS